MRIWKIIFLALVVNYLSFFTALSVATVTVGGPDGFLPNLKILWNVYTHFMGPPVRYFFEGFLIFCPVWAAFITRNNRRPHQIQWGFQVAFLLFLVVAKISSWAIDPFGLFFIYDCVMLVMGSSILIFNVWFKGEGFALEEVLRNSMKQQELADEELFGAIKQTARAKKAKDGVAGKDQKISESATDGADQDEELDEEKREARERAKRRWKKRQMRNGNDGDQGETPESSQHDGESKD